MTIKKGDYVIVEVDGEGVGQITLTNFLDGGYHLVWLLSGKYPMAVCRHVSQTTKIDPAFVKLLTDVNESEEMKWQQNLMQNNGFKKPMCG